MGDDDLPENVTLFDSLPFRDFRDPTADPDALYPLGFSGLWDSPLYFVGYAMARYLVEKEGSPAFVASIGTGPEAFFALYRAAARKHGAAPVAFSTSTERILDALGAAPPAESPDGFA